MRRIRFSSLGVAAHLPHVHVSRIVGYEHSVTHDHDFAEVFLVLDGEGTHHLNGRAIGLSVGDLVEVRPADVHSFSAPGGVALVFVNVAVSAAWWRAFHVLLGREPARRCRTVRLAAAETRSLGARLRELGATRDPVALTEVIRRAVDHFVTEAGSMPTLVSPAKAPQWLETLRGRMFESPQLLGRPISHWQRQSCVSAEHLSRSCRRFYGVTLTELLQRARIEHAKFLLRTTDSKVISVAGDAGFTNMANFHRTFARLTGQTPHRWRTNANAAVPLQAKK